MRYEDEYRFDYDDLIADADDLYEHDEWDYSDDELDDQKEWENYYHNIADEIVDD